MPTRAESWGLTHHGTKWRRMIRANHGKQRDATEMQTRCKPIKIPNIFICICIYIYTHKHFTIILSYSLTNYTLLTCLHAICHSPPQITLVSNTMNVRFGPWNPLTEGHIEFQLNANISKRPRTIEPKWMMIILMYDNVCAGKSCWSLLCPWASVLPGECRWTGRLRCSWRYEWSDHE